MLDGAVAFPVSTDKEFSCLDFAGRIEGAAIKKRKKGVRRIVNCWIENSFSSERGSSKMRPFPNCISVSFKALFESHDIAPSHRQPGVHNDIAGIVGSSTRASSMPAPTFSSLPNASLDGRGSNFFRGVG